MGRKEGCDEGLGNKCSKGQPYRRRICQEPRDHPGGYEGETAWSSNLSTPNWPTQHIDGIESACLPSPKLHEAIAAEAVVLVKERFEERAGSEQNTLKRKPWLPFAFNAGVGIHTLEKHGIAEARRLAIALAKGKIVLRPGDATKRLVPYE